jgi:hypothetical protein
MSGSGTLPSGITMQFATYAIPGGKWGESFGSGGIKVGTEAIHRWGIESTSGAYFGYDLALIGDATNGYQAVFRPLSNVGDRRRVTPAKYPPPQPVRDGETIALNLMVSPDGTQRIVDYIQIFSQPSEPAAATTTAEPRDFTVDDGAVTYDTSRMTIWTDRRKYHGMSGFRGKPGATFWIAFPGRGRYVLSLVPHDGFLKSGVARDSVLSFQDSGQEYEVRFMGPVAGRGKAWNLYVLHDQTYDPEPQLRDALTCGTDRLENLLPTH